MVLSKYLPGKTLLWKDLRVIWGTMTVFATYLTMITSVKLIYSINNVTSYPDRYQATVTFPSTYGFSAAFFTLFTVLLASSLVGRERDHKTFNLILALPYSRHQILNSKYIVGFLFLPLVFAGNALIMTAALGITNGVEFSFTVADIWLWALRHILILWYVYTFSMVIATVSGNSTGNIVLSLIFLFFPLGFLYLSLLNIEFWGVYIDLSLFYVSALENFYTTIGLLLTAPLYILAPVNHFRGGFNHTLFFVLLMLMMVGWYNLSHYLFKHNQMENNSEVLMFPKLEPVFKVGVTVCFAMVGAPFFAYYFNVSPRDGLTAMGITALLYLAVGAGVWLATHKLIGWRKPA